MKLLCWAICILAISPLVRADAGPLELKDGDRVVFVGGQMVEVDAQYGYFETMLQARFPKAHFIYRNLGWSGDTVWGDARSEFGTQEDGYRKLVDEVISARPTVLLINYGMNESFAGEAGLPAFIKQYAKLLDDLSKTGARVWLIGPNFHETMPPPLPDPAEHNKALKAYSLAISKLASDRNLGFVGLLHSSGVQQADHLTGDGIHFNAFGYCDLGRTLVDGLCKQQVQEPSRKDSPQNAAIESLRKLVNQKNREFFYRWRPQNDTYIFGFRKQEQGRNAVEIPQFDPIVQKLEQQIDEAKQNLPKPGSWTMEPSKN